MEIAAKLTSKGQITVPKAVPDFIDTNVLILHLTGDPPASAESTCVGAVAA